MRGRINKKGLVLIAVLWMVVVLGVIAATAGQNSRLDTKVSVVRYEQLRCKWACRAGIETAIAVLNDDTRESDGLTDYWSDSVEDFNDIELHKCLFNVTVVDEASKLNVNTATKEQLLGLEYMTEEIADAIIDWRDENDMTEPAGVEGGYYGNLEYPYTIRNGPFKTTRELLLVKGVTEQLLYGEDTNFNGQLDYNERDGEESLPTDNSDDQLDRGWIAYLTCYSFETNKDGYGNNRVNINSGSERRLRRSLYLSRAQAKWIVDNRSDGYKSIADIISKNSPKEASNNSNSSSDDAQAMDLSTFSEIADMITVKDDDKIIGMININTASRYVLAALLGPNENALAVADEIIAHRESQEVGMDSIAEILKVKSVTIDVFKQIAENITVRSDVYTVRCVATADRGQSRGATVQTEAVVDRSSETANILYWHQGPRAYFVASGRTETEQYERY